MNKPYEIQSLRLLDGWTVEFNKFYECDPDNCNNFWSYFNEDLLRLRNNKYNLLIDLGWYPDGDKKGAYELYLFYDYNLREPLEVFKNRDRKAVVDKIEYWTDYSFYQKYI